MKSIEEIKADGAITNFFECPAEVQEILFMFAKNDNNGLINNELYQKHDAIFNNHTIKISNFSKSFDPTARLM